MNILPSKKFLLALAACIIAGVGIFAADVLTAPSPDEKGPALTATSPEMILINKIAALDSDNDGLKDWEETLWKTNPKAQDSDSDGTLDGDEVRFKRNPALAGPNDAFSSTTVRAIEASGGTQSYTDLLAHQLFARYYSAIQGGEITEQDAAMLARTVLFQAGGTELVYTVRTRSDITISNDISEKALRTYASAMGTIILKNSTESEHEMIILKEALEKDNAASLARLDPIIRNYESGLEAFLRTPVPESLADAHLALVNSLSEVVASLKAMRAMFDDPAYGMIVVSKYPDVTVKFMNSFKTFADFYERKEIRFESSSPAYFFVTMATP